MKQREKGKNCTACLLHLSSRRTASRRQDLRLSVDPARGAVGADQVLGSPLGVGVRHSFIVTFNHDVCGLCLINFLHKLLYSQRIPLHSNLLPCSALRCFVSNS